MASRAFAATYSKHLSRTAFRSLCTLAPTYPNSESDIPTNGLDLNSLSKEVPHAEGKKNRTLNPSLKVGPIFPCKVTKDEKHARLDKPYIWKQVFLWDEDNSMPAMEEVDDEPPCADDYDNSMPAMEEVDDEPPCADDYGFDPWQLKVMKKRTDGTGYATVIMNTLLLDIHFPMVRALYIKRGVHDKYGLDGFRNKFFDHEHNVILEIYGLYKRGNTDWHVAGDSNLRYISIEDFMWWFHDIPKEYRNWIYNYMFKQQIFVLENCPETLLKLPVIVCDWRAPRDGWYKLNVSGIFKENLGGTEEAYCGEVLRDSWGTVLERFHRPLPDATSRYEVILLGVRHGMDETLQRRSEANKIILEIDHKEIFNVLSCDEYIPMEYFGLYMTIFCMLTEFDDYDVLFQYPQGNYLANRVAYIASHLTMEQSFPLCDRGYETQVRSDQLKIPRYEIIPEKGNEVEESSDEDI